MSIKINKVVSNTSSTHSIISNKHCSDAEKYFKEYSQHTGIQGFQYLAENRARIEKVFWSFIMICSLSGCAYMVGQLWSKYQKAPVFVSFATSQTPISDIPFPAVTICPESKFDNDLFGNLSIYLKKLMQEEELQAKILTSLPTTDQKQILTLALLCGSLENTDAKNIPEYVDENFYLQLKELQTEFHRSAVSCTWSNEVVNCSSLFIPIITSEGICYSFNILDKSEMFSGKILPHYLYYNISAKSDWDIDSGYQTMSLETQPKRALLSGEDFGLSLFLAGFPTELEHTCQAGQEGYRVTLHNPLDIPSPTTHYFRLPFNQAVTATVKPKLILTSQKIESYSPEKRKCYFSKERPLKYFKIYTSSNCEVECITDFILGKCGCVAFYMPRMEHTKICGVGKGPCVNKAYDQFRLEELKLRMSGSRSKCDCKSACTELSYDVELSQSTYSSEAVSQLVPDDQAEAVKEAKLSVLSIYFKSDQFLPYKRRELYGASDLVSNIGGLMSLFTGFSMISLVEIIYFLTLRIYYNVRLYGRWYGLN